MIVGLASSVKKVEWGRGEENWSVNLTPDVFDMNKSQRFLGEKNL